MASAVGGWIAYLPVWKDSFLFFSRATVFYFLFWEAK